MDVYVRERAWEYFLCTAVCNQWPVDQIMDWCFPPLFTACILHSFSIMVIRETIWHSGLSAATVTITLKQSIYKRKHITSYRQKENHLAYQYIFQQWWWEDDLSCVKPSASPTGSQRRRRTYNTPQQHKAPLACAAQQYLRTSSCLLRACLCTSLLIGGLAYPAGENQWPEQRQVVSKKHFAVSVCRQKNY